MIDAVAFLMSHLDPVCVPIFFSKTTLLFAPNFTGGLFSFFSPFYLAHKLSLITEFYWPNHYSTVCFSCICRMIFSSHSPLEAILSLLLLCMKSFSSMCLLSECYLVPQCGNFSLMAMEVDCLGFFHALFVGFLFV